MSRKGGYQLIDLKNKNLQSGASTTIKGIYNSIESNHGKALLLTGIVIGGVDKPETWITPTHNDSQYAFTAHGSEYTVTDADLVTLA